MDIDKVPLLGKLNRTVTAMIVNFVLLGVICLILGVVIPFFPQVLDFLVSALLIVASAILFAIGYHIHSYKKKYMKWFKD